MDFFEEFLQHECWGKSRNIISDEEFDSVYDAMVNTSLHKMSTKKLRDIKNDVSDYYNDIVDKQDDAEHPDSIYDMDILIGMENRAVYVLREIEGILRYRDSIESSPAYREKVLEEKVQAWKVSNENKIKRDKEDKRIAEVMDILGTEIKSMGRLEPKIEEEAVFRISEVLPYDMDLDDEISYFEDFVTNNFTAYVEDGNQWEALWEKPIYNKSNQRRNYEAREQRRIRKYFESYTRSDTLY